MLKEVSTQSPDLRDRWTWALIAFIVCVLAMTVVYVVNHSGKESLHAGTEVVQSAPPDQASPSFPSSQVPFVSDVQTPEWRRQHRCDIRLRSKLFVIVPEEMAPAGQFATNFIGVHRHVSMESADDPGNCKAFVLFSKSFSPNEQWQVVGRDVNDEPLHMLSNFGFEEVDFIYGAQTCYAPLTKNYPSGALGYITCERALE